MCAKNSTHMKLAHTRQQYWSRLSLNKSLVWSVVACCHSVKLFALAARALWSQLCLPTSLVLHDRLSLLCTAGFLNLLATEEFLIRHGLTLLKLSRFLKLNVLIKNSMCYKVLQHGNVTHGLPRSAQHAVTEGIFRQTGDFCCPENEM